MICTLRSGTWAWRHPKVPVGWNLPGQAWRIRLTRSLGVWLAQLEMTVPSWQVEGWLAMPAVCPLKTQISPPTAVAPGIGPALQSRRDPEVVAVGGREHHGIQGGSGVAPDYVAGTSRRYAVRIRTGLCHGTAADQKSLNGEWLNPAQSAFSPYELL